jgi:regulator of protease activity HflC (stomatin/prohibitin superfamily)
MKGVDAAMAAGPEGTLPWLVTGALVLAALAAAMVRVVPENQRAVVLRFGRVARVADPGLIALLPGIERLVRISLRESSLEHLRTRATTLDDVTVWVTGPRATAWSTRSARTRPCPTLTPAPRR